ncbi:hypothetical protein SAMN05444722_2533 [Rhodovulum sp. ES.010]|uniref:hypothetical protein n=1 Tax=Rhodovulum sp. ES.010 TaxID=1882821 RepID=UPI00092877D3|nr:hypothetical protein [Rhodovulum sp. ES.010]SIO48408.1 hypothetical protein SAMN05444722_2533 [Rhodovulum sp. ES.010]
MTRAFASPCLALCLLAGLAAPTPAGEVMLTHRDLVRAGPALWTAPGFTLPAQDTGLPIVGGANTEDGARLLRHLNGTRAINGFEGIVYDNRDRGHSRLRPELFPRLTHLVYGADLSAENMDYGLAGRIILPAVVFGNSSTARTGGPVARSQTRLAMTNPRAREITTRLYFHNHIFVYPEHRDHDAADRFPANWAYNLTSQGSSGSDRRFLSAIALTLAAFPAETFAKLREERLVTPTVQMILRRNLAGVSSRGDYLSGGAHPVVFAAGQLRTGRMVALAADMRPGDIPPVVRLEVVEESFTPAAGLAGRNERFFDTTSAIARIWRGFRGRNAMVVSAADTTDPNGRALRFEWRLLQGDPARVRIEPLDEEGRRARITVDWHDPVSEPTPGGEGHETRLRSRVDIGVFAHNGVHDSAPGFVSISFPAHQARVYAPGPDGAPRLVSIDYDARARGQYYDPVLHWSAPWKDTARYDAAGTLAGWDRQRPGAVPRFVPETGADADGGFRYSVDRSDPAAPVLRPAGE